MISRVLVANRGEIAVRIIAGCRAAGIECVAIYSDADREGLWTHLADRALCIGPAAASESYLNAAAIVSSALGTECDAVHPGYGFLAENAAFAQLCEDNGITFIGPSADAIARMGNKIAARALAAEAGVATIPGSPGRLADLDDARRAGELAGYPLLLKVAAGGGGRGMRVVRSASELGQNFREAEAEARSAFGDGTLYAEKFLEGVRHIEVQIAGDAHGSLLHLGERDCTLQRRAQKVLEEAPAVALGAAEGQKMRDSATALARKISYRNLGTIEFVFEPASKAFYFLEMNTRIQVEHPVTELVTGLDLVVKRLHIAADEPLGLRQDEIQVRGHAIECRINAEEAGTITTWVPPGGEGVRVDTHVYAGYTVPPYYDPLLAKLIVWGATRDQAMARARDALASFRIEGPRTTLDLQRRLLDDENVIANRTDTKWLERTLIR